MDVNVVLNDYLEDPRRELEGFVRLPYCSQFFIPNPEFVEWCVATYPDFNWVDCGSGQGHITQLLRDAGLNVAAVDLYASEDTVISDTIPMDAAKFPFKSNTVALMCRPCRGDWIHATIIKAVESGSPMVYVGKSSNFINDVIPLPYNVTVIKTNIGICNESMWLIYK